MDMLGLKLPSILLATLTLLATPAAAEPQAINTLGGDGVAIHGYDPVAYFVDGGPRRGRPEFAVAHAGAVWRFASEANKRRFEREPGRYLPAFGGYCAYGVAQGYLVKIDPEAWSIVEGRLYLNYDLRIRDAWLNDVPGFIAKAGEKWPRLARSAAPR